MQKFIITIKEENLSLVFDDAIECFILSDSLSKNFIKQFIDKAHEQGKLVLADTKSLCLTNAFDGIILDLSKSENIAKDYADATKDLKGKLIGVISRSRRHEAMLVSECEPDFVIFKGFKDGKDKIIELTDWYNDFFLIQSALWIVDEDLDFTDFKTDFVILNDIKYKNFVAKA